MNRVPFHNSTDKGMYVGNVFIPAGGTRTVDAALLPPAQETPAEASPDAGDPIAALAAGKVTEIVAALPGLDADQLKALDAAERAGKNRTTVLEAIALRQLEVEDQADQAEKERIAAEEAEQARLAAEAAGDGGDNGDAGQP